MQAHRLLGNMQIWEQNPRHLLARGMFTKPYPTNSSLPDTSTGLSNTVRSGSQRWELRNHVPYIDRPYPTVFSAPAINWWEQLREALCWSWKIKQYRYVAFLPETLHGEVSPATRNPFPETLPLFPSSVLLFSRQIDEGSESLAR